MVKKQKPIITLIESNMLNDIAAELKDLMKDSEPSKNSEINKKEIVAKTGLYSGKFQRTMEFEAETAEENIAKFLVSDGNKNRNQRLPLVNPDVKRVGIDTSTHCLFLTIIVIVSCPKNG